MQAKPIASTGVSGNSRVSSGESRQFEDNTERQRRLDYIKLKLLVAGGDVGDDEFQSRLSVPYEVVSHLKERIRLSYGAHSPMDQRVQIFLDYFLANLGDDARVRIPGLGQSFVLDRAGMAKELSLPEHGDIFESDIISSYRLANDQGILNNPKNDRRTTQGVFHVANDGHPVPYDKVCVPKEAFAKLLRAALQPPANLNTLPFTSEYVHPIGSLVSLLIRPLVVPEVDGVMPERSMEIRFMAPGNLVSNLDFIERIFGNAGDPFLAEHDSGLDVEHWTGHTGYIVLAPHIRNLKKKDLGLPHVDNATARQKRDRMCWSTEDEKYNNGDAFKITARDENGVVVTIIADNYYGYCKKEVKTQMSFAANLLGLVEEEHSGGALVFPQYDLGKTFSVKTHLPRTEHTFERVRKMFSHIMELKFEGYGVDRVYPDILYVPENVFIDLNSQSVSWTTEDGLSRIPLAPDKTYIVPSGFKIRLEREVDSGQWRLVGTNAEGTFCHKPSTVSGGGKSEISKPISNAIMHGPFFIADFQRDLDAVEALLNHDYSRRFRLIEKTDSRPILSMKRSIGSVIKLLTQSETLYTPEYNAWLESIPHSIRELVYLVKRFYRPEMGNDWRSHISVDVVNNRSGNALKFDEERIVSHYMRVGFTALGNWRIFSLRNDFVPAEKLQQEDDITVSVVLPATALTHLNPRYEGPKSVKLVSKDNPERRFFQRPDEAIHRGYDKATEAHFALPDNFVSNFAPLTPEDAKVMLASPITLGEFTQPMRDVIRAAASSHGYFVSSAHPRIVDGKPSKNPRFLQVRPDLFDPYPAYLGETGARMYRECAPDEPIYFPVNAVLPGRRLNPPDAAAGIRSLAVYNPIHYQEAPELFMELISSLTGQSPSTTGAGSEGALTKGPFNALLPIIDLNAALVSHLLTGTEAFVTAAGYIGPKFQVDHDISILIPEIWSRMDPAERDPKFLIENNYLEKCEDFECNGRTVQASRLGYRITNHFVRTFFGIIFDNPNDLFSDEMLRPETQDLAVFADGVDNIVETQRSIAENYFRDGSIDIACPPLRALLHIMRDGQYEGKTANSIEVRKLFTVESMLDSQWYRDRLHSQRQVDIHLWRNHVSYLKAFLDRSSILDVHLRRDIEQRLSLAQEKLDKASHSDYENELNNTIGVDPSVAAALLA